MSTIITFPTRTTVLYWCSAMTIWQLAASSAGASSLPPRATTTLPHCTLWWASPVQSLSHSPLTCPPQAGLHGALCPSTSLPSLSDCCTLKVGVSRRRQLQQQAAIPSSVVCWWVARCTWPPVAYTSLALPPTCRRSRARSEPVWSTFSSPMRSFPRSCWPMWRM